MSTRSHWLLTLTAVVALTAGGVYFADALQRALSAGAMAAVLQQETSELETRIAAARLEQPRIAMWRDTAAEVRQIGLEPQNWRIYPVSISRVLPWEDVAGVVLIASNALPRPGDYWFQPSMLRVLRVDQPSSEEQSADQEPERYDMHFEGHFLIPERNQP